MIKKSSSRLLQTDPLSTPETVADVRAMNPSLIFYYVPLRALADGGVLINEISSK